VHKAISNKLYLRKRKIISSGKGSETVQGHELSMEELRKGKLEGKKGEEGSRINTSECCSMKRSRSQRKASTLKKSCKTKVCWLVSRRAAARKASTTPHLGTTKGASCQKGTHGEKPQGTEQGTNTGHIAIEESCRNMEIGKRASPEGCEKKRKRAPAEQQERQQKRQKRGIILVEGNRSA